MLDNGATGSLRFETASGRNASEYAKFNERDVYDPKVNVSFF